MSGIEVTVFTPTYNRKHTLPELYRSLRAQTDGRFEWLVIDDGSTDGTQELFDAWAREPSLFPIRYVRVENGGKHRAINRGTALARGRLFLIVDSDDFLREDAIQKILLWESELPEGGRFAGVAGSCGYRDGGMIGSGCAGGRYADCTSQERGRFGIEGDKAEAVYTALLRQFPFPTFEGENFLTESVVWFAIGKADYRIRWYNDIIYIAEYLPDGLTQSGMEKFRKNPRGYLLTIRSDLDNLENGWIRRMGYYAAYARTAKDMGCGAGQTERDLHVSAFTVRTAVFLKACKDLVLRTARRLRGK